jgi:hypothetical protein
VKRTAKRLLRVYYQQRVTEPCINAVANGIRLSKVKPYDKLK